MDALNAAANAIVGFVVLYPLALCWMGIVGAWLFFFKWESRSTVDPVLPRYPQVSVLVCCDAAPADVERTILQLEAQRYPHLEILALHDSAVPAMGPLLDRLMLECPRLRVVHTEGETQHAVLLRTGAMLAKGEFLVCVAPGALVDTEAMVPLLQHFLGAGRVGAVVGQAMVLRPRGVFEQIAAAEYTLRGHVSPRAAAIYGKQVVLPIGLVAYRKSALHQTGYWTIGAETPELQLLWNLQAARWGVRFEPQARYWIAPERGIAAWLRARNTWRAQVRQAVKVLRPALSAWRNRRLWFFHTRHCLDIAWICAVWAVLLYAATKAWLPVEVALSRVWLTVAPGTWLAISVSYAVLVKRLAATGGPDERPPLLAVLLAPSVYWLLNVIGSWVKRRKPEAAQRWEESSVSAR